MSSLSSQMPKWEAEVNPRPPEVIGFRHISSPPHNGCTQGLTLLFLPVPHLSAQASLHQHSSWRAPDRAKFNNSN